jgi:hypothetical protein
MVLKRLALGGALCTSIFWSAFGSATANADATLSPLYRGAATTAMGGATVATATDEDGIFVNPATMAGNKGFEFHLMPVTLETSTDTISSVSNTVKAFHNLDSNSLNVLVGRDIFANAQIAPALVIPNFGVSYVVDQQVGLTSRNLSLPQFNLGYQTTEALQFAYGVSVLPASKGKKDPVDDLRIGVGYTFAWRRGGFYPLSLNQLVNMSQSSLDSIIGGFQSASAPSIGAQYIRNINPRLKIQWGLAYDQIGDLNFGNPTETQDANLSTGVAAIYKFTPYTTGTFEYDLQNLNENVEFQKKNHLGVKLAVPLLTFYAGLNETLPTFGAAVDLWLLKLTVASYAQEQDALVGEDGQRRYLVSLDIKIGI